MQLCDILSLAGYEESQGILRRWGMFLRNLWYVHCTTESEACRLILTLTWIS